MRAAASPLHVWLITLATVSGCQCYTPVEQCDPPPDAGPNYHDTCTEASDCRDGNFWYCGGEVFRRASCIDGRCLYDRYRRTCTTAGQCIACDTYRSCVPDGGCGRAERCTMRVTMTNCPGLAGTTWRMHTRPDCTGVATSLDGKDTLGTWYRVEAGQRVADFPRLGGRCAYQPGTYIACPECELFADEDCEP